MARLRLPERCAACGGVFIVGDRIVFERRATIIEGRGAFVRVTDPATGFWNYEREATLEPRVESQSPRNVRHLECPDAP